MLRLMHVYNELYQLAEHIIRGIITAHRGVTAVPLQVCLVVEQVHRDCGPEM